MYTSIVKRGKYLLVRGYENGRKYTSKVEFRPTLWMSSRGGNASDAWTTLTGQTVYAVQPGNMQECRDYLEMYKDVHGMDIYESPGHVYQFIAENYTGELNWSADNIDICTVDIETKTEYGFPEPQWANEEILLITIKNTRKKTFTTFGVGPYDNTRDDVNYIQCQTEQELLKEFIIFWQQDYPDAITGWNSSLFDTTYLYNRMVKVLGETLANKLSPWGIIDQREVDLGGRTAIKTVIGGVASLDYLDLYKKFTYTAQESYRLDYIAEVELGENKLENPAATFKDFYTYHWQTFVNYNIHDVALVDKLDNKMKLIDLALTMAYDAKILYEDVFSSVKTWDVIIYNYLNDRKMVIPRRKNEIKTAPFEGAFVKDPLVGKHNWCVSFDLNSLYPHLIMQYNMSPETIADMRMDVTVDRLLNKEVDLSPVYERDLAMAGNGWTYRRDKMGLLPTLMKLYYDRRVDYKKAMLKAKQDLVNVKTEIKARQSKESTSSDLSGMPLDVLERLQSDKVNEISRLNNLQMAVKIAINSAYGAMGNKHFRYFDIRIAEGITISGQLSIRWIANKLNEYFNKLLKTDDADRIVLIDTDSVVLTLNDLVQKVYGADGKVTLPADKVIEFMDRVAEDKIQPYIDQSYQELADYMGAYAQKMQMKRENLVDVMIAVAKKRYVMSVYNSEGVQYKEPQMKVMGLAMIKSSTPAVIRDKLKNSLNTILRGTETDVHKYVSDFKTEFMKLTPEQIAFPRGVSDVSKYSSSTSVYVKGTPIHVRGALLYNHYLKKNKLDKKYQLIKEGDKIKFMYLRVPNTIQEDCIAFLDRLPEEFGLHEYVDYNKMFEKTFEDAVQNVLDPIGWSTKQKATLDDWFV